MTTSDPRREPREPGYRGALRPRHDRLAVPWILAVITIFVLVILLAGLGIPSRFAPEPTPSPTPSATSTPAATDSAEPSAAASADESASADASVEPSETADPSESAEASGS